MRKVAVYIAAGDDAVRDSLRLLLECEGFVAFPFASGTDFLRHRRAEGPCCAVLDMELPDMSALALLERIGDDASVLVRIVMTVRRDAAIRRDGHRTGVVLLEKPFVAAALLIVISDAVLNARLH